jgi:hypothetical protein
MDFLFNIPKVQLNEIKRQCNRWASEKPALSFAEGTPAQPSERPI